jgi:hypothetical protein
MAVLAFNLKKIYVLPSPCTIKSHKDYVITELKSGKVNVNSGMRFEMTKRYPHTAPILCSFCLTCYTES